MRIVQDDRERKKMLEETRKERLNGDYMAEAEGGDWDIDRDRDSRQWN
jgi:hypothetical protein